MIRYNLATALALIASGAASAQTLPPFGPATADACRPSAVSDPPKAGSDGTLPIGLLNAARATETGGNLRDLRGDDATYFGAVPVQGWEIRRGTAAAPASGAGAAVKISKVEKVLNLSEMGGNKVDNRYNAALLVSVQALAGSLGQPAAIMATAKGAPMGTDVLGLASWASIDGAANGYAYGGYFEARADNVTGGAHGIEARARNVTATSFMTYPKAASRYHAVWATISDGPGNAAFAAGSGDGTATWDAAFQSTYGGGYRTAAYIVEGVPLADTSVALTKGLYARNRFTSIIDMSHADARSGAVVLPSIVGIGNGINFGDHHQIYADKVDGIVINAAKIGFGVSSVAKPTLPAAATDLATVIALVNAIRATLIANGLAK